jgi:hypothetical protein
VLGPIAVALAETANGHPFFRDARRARATRRDHFWTDGSSVGAPDLLQLVSWRRISIIAAAAPPAALIAVLSPPGAKGSPSEGWNVLAVFYAFWELFFAWGAILALLVFFKRHFAALGPVWRNLARRAYLIYIIHPPILAGVSLSMRSLAAPALVKFALAGSATCALCFFAAGALLKAPPVRRVV